MQSHWRMFSTVFIDIVHVNKKRSLPPDHRGPAQKFNREFPAFFSGFPLFSSSPAYELITLVPQSPSDNCMLLLHSAVTSQYVLPLG